VQTSEITALPPTLTAETAAALAAWAESFGVRFVNRSDGQRTTDTVSRDALMALAASHADAAAPAPAVQAVAWHVRIIGCDGPEDWVELGATAPTDIPPEAEALALVYAAAPVAQPLTEEQMTAMATAAQTPGWGEWCSDADALARYTRAVERRAAAAQPLTDEQRSCKPREYGDDLYTEAQRQWCLRYERETTFEPLMCDYEAGNQSFVEAARRSVEWFEGWANDAHLNAGKDIPGWEDDFLKRCAAGQGQDQEGAAS
jgi:hypothetical protein